MSAELRPTGQVFVVDRDDDARSALVTLLESASLQVVALASTMDLLATVERAQRGCVVADLGSSEAEGIELVRGLRASGSDLPVIIVAEQAEVASAVRVMKAGAADFLQKPYENQRVLSAVRECLDVDAHAAGAAAARQSALRVLTGLTPRERQVMDLVVEGASNKTIASTLAISPGTVEGYRASVMDKTGAASLADLVRISMSAVARRPPAATE